VLKGGETLGGAVVKKEKKKKVKKVKAVDGTETGLEGANAEQEVGEEAAAEEKKLASTKIKPAVPTAINVMSGKNYEEEFDLENARMLTGHKKNTPWGSSHRIAPEILHGYDRKVTGVTAEERLDMRAATKTDRFCK